MTTTTEYSKIEAISQSAIKDFERMSPLEWKSIWIDGQKDESRDESIFLFGTVLDILLFTPETFKDKFYVTDIETPSAAVTSIITNYYTKLVNENINRQYLNEKEPLPVPFELLKLDVYHDDLLLECAKSYTSIDKETGDVKFGWQNNWKDQTILDNLRKQGQAYFNLLVEVNNKKIISHHLYSQAVELKNVLTSHPLTKDWFVVQEGVDLFFQHECVIEIDNIKRKLSIDIKRVDHNNKTIQRADFKTTPDSHNFLYSIKKYGYCKQLSFYDWHDSILDKEKYPNYNTLLPINIVIDKKNKIPYIYEHSLNDLTIERLGSFKHRVKGWENTLIDIDWHMKTGIWEQPKELYLNQKINVMLYD